MGVRRHGGRSRRCLAGRATALSGGVVPGRSGSADGSLSRSLPLCGHRPWTSSHARLTAPSSHRTPLTRRGPAQAESGCARRRFRTSCERRVDRAWNPANTRCGLCFDRVPQERKLCLTLQCRILASAGLISRCLRGGKSYPAPWRSFQYSSLSQPVSAHINRYQRTRRRLRLLRHPRGPTGLPPLR